MELTEKLKLTLENTYSLALRLEEVSSMIIPKKIGERGRKRLININRELKNFNSVSKTKEKITEIFKKPDKKAVVVHNETFDLRSEYTSNRVKKGLSISIKEVNQRVKLSKAGKASVAKCMSAKRANLRSYDHASLASEISPKYLMTEAFDDKPQPYVCLTNGKIEDPISLPSFDEFLLSKGEDFNVKRGKDELFYRIDKATEQINKFKEHLQSKTFGRMTEDKLKFIKQTSKLFTKEENPKTGKKNDLKSLMNQYFKMPCLYESPKISRRQSSANPSYRSSILSSDAEEALEGTLRQFNQTKLIENRKILDILDKLRVDRPKLMKQKVQLIQTDKEKYKNKHHSIEKFKHFRELIEKSKREDQFKIYQQGLVYLEILDEFKRHRHKPVQAELLVLGLWKRVIESGCVVTQTEFEEILAVVATFTNDLKDVHSLLDKLSSSITV